MRNKSRTIIVRVGDREIIGGTANTQGRGAGLLSSKALLRENPEGGSILRRERVGRLRAQGVVEGM